MLLITSIEAQSLSLSKSKEAINETEFRKFILFATKVYGLSLPDSFADSILFDYIKNNEQGFTLKQIEDALKLNLSGKFGQIVKVFNAELTCIFLSQIFLEYEKYLDNIKLKEFSKKQTEKMKEENIKAEKQNLINRENFKNDTIAQFKAKTLIPRFYHWKILIEAGLIIEDKDRLQTCFEMEQSKIDNQIINPFDIVAVVPLDENTMNRAKEYYLKIELLK